MNTALTENQQKLLYLIDLYCKNSGEELTWIKEYAVYLLTYYLIKQNVLDYDYSPILMFWNDKKRLVNISFEMLRDLTILREKCALVAQLKIATTHYHYIQAYTILEKGKAILNEIPEAFKKEVDDALKCKRCGALMRPVIKSENEDMPIMVCEDCGYSEEIPIFEIEDVSYKIKPFKVGVFLTEEE